VKPRRSCVVVLLSAQAKLIWGALLHSMLLRFHTARKYRSDIYYSFIDSLHLH
jgi:hypothetical protein